MGQLSRDSKTGFLKVGVHGVQGISDVTKVEKLLSTRGHFCFLPPHLRCGLRRLGDWTAGFILLFPTFSLFAPPCLTNLCFLLSATSPHFPFEGRWSLTFAGITLLICLTYPDQQAHSWIRTLEKWTRVHRKTCTLMFIATLFLIVQKKKDWKQPKCLSMDEWTNRYIHTMGYCSVNKERNYLYSNNLDRPPRLYAEQMNPISEAYMLYESIYMTVCEIQNYRDKEISGCQHLAVGGGSSIQDKHEGVFWGDGTILYSSTCKTCMCQNSGNCKPHVLKFIELYSQLYCIVI